MNLTIHYNEYSFTINNQQVILCLFYFCVSAISAHFFKKANLFFKIFVFLFILSVFTMVQEADRIEVTISALLGVLVVYGESILEFAFIVRGWIEFITDCIRSFLSLVLEVCRFLYYGLANFFTGFYNLLSRLFGWSLKFNRLGDQDEKPKAKKDSSGKQKQQKKQQENRNRQQADREEALRQAKEKMRQQREEAKREEEQEVFNKDNRNYQEILNLSENFTLADLRKAHKLAISRYHPDRYNHMSESFRKEAEQEFIKIQQAYNTLLARFT